MQITKYWIAEFSNPLDSYKKFYTALRVQGIPLLKEDYNNGFFEVNSVYAPSVMTTATTTGIPIQFVSTRTVTDTKPTPRPVVNPTPKPSPTPSPTPNTLPADPIPKPAESDNSGTMLLGLALIFGFVAFGDKKKKRR
ncbi:MAG: hypothetical protein IPL26_00165 [Leptospiraceae bacterium]|nr:hypothetical protein [Leptospiraceae bacterium]